MTGIKESFNVVISVYVCMYYVIVKHQKNAIPWD